MNSQTLFDMIKIEMQNQTKELMARMDEKLIPFTQEIKDLRQENQVLREKVTRLEKFERSNNIVIHGFKEIEGSTTDLMEIIMQDLNTYLNLDLESKDFNKIYRIGQKDTTGTKNRPILISFVNCWMRNIILKNKKKLENYYVSEDYPKEVLDKRRELQGRMNEEREKGNYAIIKYNKLIIKEKNSETGNRKRDLSVSPDTPTQPGKQHDLLEDESIYKVGVAACDDAKYLFADYSVKLRSTLDIRHLAQLNGYNAGGLASLSKSLLRIVMDKSWRVRCSNWGADELTDRQTQYAATDAHVAIKIFVNLINDYGRQSWMSWFSKNNDVWRDLDTICYKYADINFKTKQKVKKSDFTGKDKSKEWTVLSKRYPHATRSKPLYHNCFLEAPDGEMLCTCDNKKALWYVEKQLADVVKEQPLTVRLRFEPAGRSVGDVGRYYQLTKENKCVVCGSTDSYIRKNVVPREYRKYFPEIMKDHSSHDVVLLCVDCHQTSNMLDQSVRERLAEQCSAPLSGRGEHNTKYTEDADCKKIRSAARALLSTKHELPEARRIELENILLQFYPHAEKITLELLKEASVIQVVYENTDYESHGLKVVEYYLKEGGLLKLEEVWREHFLTSMQPRYMPELWSVKHNEERLQVRLNEGRLSEQDLKLIGLSRWL